MPDKNTRRAFIKTASAGGAAILTAGAQAQTKRQPYKRKSPSSVQLIEVGIITCGYFSHIEDIWGVFMNPPLEEKRGVFWPRSTGIVMTMVWDPDPKAAESFAKKYDLKVVKNYYDMVDKVDAIIMSDYYATGWWPQLSKPYLEAGMPVLINRPFALSLKEAKEMVELSKKHNAPILVPSSDETMMQGIRLKYKLKKLLDQGAYITGALATEPTTEYAAHGLHSIYGLHMILEPDVKSVGLLADKWWDFKQAFMTWRCRQGDKQDYYVGINMASEDYTFGWIMVSTSIGRVEEHEDITRGDDWTLFKDAFIPTCLEFAKMVETRKMPQSYEQIMSKTSTFLTGFYSFAEKGGSMVNCSDLPEDWRAPQIMPERIPKDIFK